MLEKFFDYLPPDLRLDGLLWWETKGKIQHQESVKRVRDNVGWPKERSWYWENVVFERLIWTRSHVMSDLKKELLTLSGLGEQRVELILKSPEAQAFRWAMALTGFMEDPKLLCSPVFLGKPLPASCVRNVRKWASPWYPGPWKN